jgi:hypothetical protein
MTKPGILSYTGSPTQHFGLAETDVSREATQQTKQKYAVWYERVQGKGAEK